MASCMAENGLTEPVIGVTFDGTGFGTDGAIWGGEFLVGDYREFRRAAHLRYVGMPGGEQAIREPWRMAVGPPARCRAQIPTLRAYAFCRPSATRSSRMLERRLNTPLTSSAGRLFDAVAALAGVRPGQLRRAGGDRAGMAGHQEVAGTDLSLRDRCDRRSGRSRWSIDTRPLIRGRSRTSVSGVECRRHRPALPYDPGGAHRRGLRPAPQATQGSTRSSSAVASS